MLTAGTIILLLKISVTAVTILLVCSLAALWLGSAKWHGRINIVVFVLTMMALLGLEVVAQLIQPTIFKEHFTRHDAWAALYVHLGFAVPAAVLLPVMLFSGWRRKIWFHYRLGWVFLIFWTGTVITGVFFLPH